MAKSLKLFTTPSTALFAVFVLVSFILFHSAAVKAAPNASSDKGQQQRAEALTQSLHDLGQTYQQGNPEARQQALTQLQKVAVERYELLLDLVEEEPATISRIALPNSARKNMPEALRGYIEQRVQAQGTLESFYEDYEDGSHKLRHFLKIDDEIVSLNFQDSPPSLASGQQVAVNGLYLGFDTDRQQSQGVKGALILDSGDDLLMLAYNSTTEGTASSSTVEVLPNTTGEQRTLVLAVNFLDKTSEPWSLDYISSMIFGDINDWYQENSFGQTSIAGDVHGYYTLPINSTCSSLSISGYADNAATADGINLGDYDRIIYVFPRITACSWGGKGSVGGSPSRTYINGWLTPAVVIHELGHNLGLHHSHHLNCDSVPLAENCSVNEYGDLYDVMGTNNTYHFNAYQKERLGWLTDLTGDIVTVNDSGSFFLEPYEIAPGNYPKVLKVSRDATADDWYYLEYRQAIGFDSPLEGNANVLNGLIFHNASTANPDSSMLLDMTPTSTSGFNDAALEYGNSYTDPNTGITVTTGLPNSTGTYAEISFGQERCVRSTPGINFLTTESAWVSAGTDVDYSLTVTNNDSSACVAAALNLAANLPQGWSASFSDSSVNLNPGQSTTVTLTVTSATDAVDGFYDFSASVSASASGTGTDTATYIIENTSSNAAPVAEDDSVVLTQKSSVTINVLSNDYDPDQDQIVIDSITQGSKGSVTMNADNTLTYTPAKRFKDQDVFSYSIVDGEGGTAVASVLITLQASSGDDTTEGGGGNTNKGKGKPTK